MIDPGYCRDDRRQARCGLRAEAHHDRRRTVHALPTTPGASPTSDRSRPSRCPAVEAHATKSRVSTPVASRPAAPRPPTHHPHPADHPRSEPDERPFAAVSLPSGRSACDEVASLDPVWLPDPPHHDRQRTIHTLPTTPERARRATVRGRLASQPTSNPLQPAKPHSRTHHPAAPSPARSEPDERPFAAVSLPSGRSACDEVASLDRWAARHKGREHARASAPKTQPTRSMV
ncbi:hypothetical protein APR12_006071 [Nocardia amikacinitolerans]|nr:hypothetical protein [Nocardia amikacinitolerans]